MGIMINNRSLSAKKMMALQSPVILCIHREDFIKAIAYANIQAVSLNLPLAKSFFGKTEREIILAFTDTVISLLPKGDGVYLQDYEMLFDPRYKLDVLKMFYEISRYNKLIVKWCGGFDGNSLIYAEQGYADYSNYKVSDYDVACVI